jgi:organic radical activating enzyme
MLFDQKPFSHPSFCVLPWHGKEIFHSGKSTHCCLLPENYDIDKIRSEMKQGIRPVECSKCWKLEDSNLLSDRYIKNATLDFYLKKNIADIMRDADQENTLMAKIISSFTCNSACVYCNSGSSSYWNTIERRMDKNIPIRSYKLIEIKTVEQQLDLAKIKTLTFLGGEPFLERQNFEILQRMLDLDNQTAFISITTNGSIHLSEEYQNILSNFPNLNINLSIDGSKRFFEYQRWPIKWSDIEKQIEVYRKITPNISAICTITNLSLLYYNDAKDWFRSQNIPWLTNPVYEPDIFHPSVLPVPVKHRLRNLLDPADFDAYIGDPDHDVSPIWERFLLEIKRQDAAKKINIRDYIPEFCNMVGI